MNEFLEFIKSIFSFCIPDNVNKKEIALEQEAIKDSRKKPEIKVPSRLESESKTDSDSESISALSEVPNTSISSDDYEQLSSNESFIFLEF